MNWKHLSCLAVPVLVAAAAARAQVETPGPAASAASAERARPAATVDPAPPQPEPAPAEAEEPTLQPPQSIYDEAFDKARTAWLQDPLRHLEGDMSHCVVDLTEFKTHQPVQQRQDNIANRLDAVIKLLEKQCSGAGGGGPNPTSPLQRSILAKGPGGQGEMHDPKAGEKQWASLPPKQREQILQSRTEGFPPGFEALLQSYYQRLAQEQLDEPAGGAATPSTPPEGESGAEGVAAPVIVGGDAPVAASPAGGAE